MTNRNPKNTAASFLLVLFLFTAFGVVRAEASDPERSPKGLVKSVSKTEIVVTEYNSDKNAEVDVTYQLTPDTTTMPGVAAAAAGDERGVSHTSHCFQSSWQRLLLASLAAKGK